MRMWQWTQDLSKMREADRIECEENVAKILKNPKTVSKTIDDYPAILEYLNEKFPSIPLHDVKIYIVSCKAMNDAGWKHAGGCYIHHMNLILVKRRLSHQRKHKHEFDRIFAEETRANMSIEDILVHELIHAVSGRANRSTRNFVNQEEEFVFTNCIDFYKQKGMNDDEIIRKVFLPFCTQNVLEDGTTLRNVLSKYVPAKSEIMHVLKNPYKILDKHAETIVRKITEKGKSNARSMIDSYNRYGCKTYFVSEAPLTNRKVKFASIDLD